MTLILTLANTDQVIQLSDRLLSVDGALIIPLDDERNKAGEFRASDAQTTIIYSRRRYHVMLPGWLNHADTE